MVKKGIKLKKFKETKYNELGTGLTEAAGKVLAESLNRKGHVEVLKEYKINLKEDVDTTNASGAYTTLLSSFMNTAVVNDDRVQKHLDLVTVNEDMMNGNGFGAYKIPISEPTLAYEVAEGGIVNYWDEGVSSITVTPKKIVAGTAITHEMVKRGMGDFVKYVLNQGVDAIKRKLCGDIVNGLAAGAGNTNATGISYASYITAVQDVENAAYGNGVKYGFLADKFVVASSVYAALMADADFKQAMYMYNANPAVKAPTVGMVPLYVGNTELLISPFLTGAQALVLDSTKAAMLVKESDIETFEGQINTRPYDKEIVSVMMYTTAIIYPDAISAITASA